MRTGATFYTVSSARFFPGCVALINSLRVTGHQDDVVVIDAGLTDEQRATLAGHVRVERPPEEIAESPYLLKAYPYVVGARGTIVVIDSDIIVTRSLGPVLAGAQGGKVYVCPDEPESWERWFSEWHELFALEQPLRRQRYANSGFVAFSVDRRPDLLRRWWEACTRLASSDEQPHGPADPTWYPDQDALNALLMSEMPSDAIAFLEAAGWLPPELFETRVVDESNLGSEYHGRPTTLLQYTGSPKPWDRRGWLRASRDAYVRLFVRLTTAPDLPIRIPPEQLPLWLRPTVPGRALLILAGAANRTARVAATRTPRRLEERLRRLLTRVASP